MEVTNTMGAAELLRKYLAEADPDLLRSMVQSFAEALMSAEATGLCNAEYGEVTAERVNSRNGYRSRRWDTRAGTIDLAIPKLRSGSYFPDWLIEPRRRAERALVAVVAQCYVEGVSTRRVDDVVKSMGIEGISKSQVSELAKSLDETVTAFRNRPLDAGPYTYIWVDALTQKVREGGRIVNVAVVVATGVNADGHREILGVDLITTEDGAGWTAFLRGLVARGLSGVALVISDAHQGLVDAIASVLPGADLAAVPGALRAQRPHPGAEDRPVHGRGPHPVDLRAARRRTGPRPARPGGRTARRTIPRRRHHAGRGRSRHPGLLLVPEGALATDLVQQPPGAAQPGDPPAHRRRRHLPQPARRPAPGRCRARRAARRVGRGPSLHGHRVPRQGPAPGDGRNRRGGGPGRTRRRQLEQQPKIDVVVVVTPRVWTWPPRPPVCPAQALLASSPAR